MLRISQRPAGYPVTLDEAKAQLRVSSTKNDALISGLIGAATGHCEALVQRAFVPRTFQWVLPCWRPVIEIPIAPVVYDAIHSIKYVDWATETQQTLDPASYVVQTACDSVRIFPKFGMSWPLAFSHAPEPIVIEFDAGYEDLEDLPAIVKTCILLQIRHLYSIGETNPALVRDLVIGVSDKAWQLSPDVKTLIPDAVSLLMLSEVW
ncbi:head-tail connector protein [Bradyrhizobium septentrionale]|uniref:head-tail connector protein n=1 Tax=Bradyrhizobium septentrionale TaxID=1404411 RepID=UPI001596BDBD|nr:head-tail connector protein [Bradyrhizobium septentrionale]UGY23187.1 head-tail connector protein [Bradyrhizobium septentrionale]